MKTRNYFSLMLALCLLLALTVSSTFAQNPTNSYCQLSFDENLIGPLPQAQNSGNPPEYNTTHYLRIYVHVLRDGNGEGGMTEEQVRVSLKLLDEIYNPLGLFFVREDCDIDYIDSDDYFEQTYDPAKRCLILEKTDASGNLLYEHQDGVDIYFDSPETILTPDGGNAGGGSAMGLPSSHVFLWGKWSTNVDSEVSAALSTIFIHEMEHSLGLFHTHHGTAYEEGTNCDDTDATDLNQCTEYVYPNGSDQCGDYVYDTPADPGLAHNVSPDCIWTPYPGQSLIDGNGYPYSPDLENYMGYSSIECQTHFSDGQVSRMHRVIDLSPILSACVVSPDYTNKVVSSSETWTTTNTPNNGNFTIEGDLIIENGAVLTISQDLVVRFGKESKVIIEPGGKLKLYGTLTGKSCNSSTWKGIEVWGNSSLPQSSYPIAGANHGTFIGIKGTIENAEIAISNFGPDSDHAGGIIKCSSMTFRNNIIGAKFSPYQHLASNGQPRSDLSYFNSCNFLIDDYYVNETPFNSFIHLFGANGIKIRGCNFLNDQTITETQIIDYGYGIYSEDSDFTVEAACAGTTAPCNDFIPSTFTGLGEAIFAQIVYQEKPFIVEQSIFENCFIGVRNSGVNTGTILFNEFYLGDLPSASSENRQYGVVYESSVEDIYCQQNTFIGNGSTPSVEKIGIYCQGIGEDNKEVRDNKFYSMDIGNLSDGQNGVTPNPGLPPIFKTGLVYLCNENFNANPEGNDIKIARRSKVREDQGDAFSDDNGNIVFISAGNRFSYTGVDFNREGFGSQGTPVNYHYYSGGQNELPAYEGSVFPLAAAENTCPDEYCKPPCKTEGEISIIKGEYFIKKPIFEGLKEDYISFPSDEKSAMLSYYHKEMDKEVSDIIKHAMYDTIGYDPDTLLIWVERSSSIGGELWRMRDKVLKNDFVAANTILNELPQKFDLTQDRQEDIDNVEEILNLLDGQAILKLDENTLNVLKGYEEVGGDAEIWAKNILTSYGSYYPPRYPKNNEEEGDDKKYDKPNNNQDEKEITYLTLQPNPANSYVDFLFKEFKEAHTTYLVIKDIQGKIVFRQNVLPYETTRWNIENKTPSGIYLYQLISAEELIQSGKIIVEN